MPGEFWESHLLGWAYYGRCNEHASIFVLVRSPLRCPPPLSPSQTHIQTEEEETALDYSSGVFKSSTYHSFHFAFGEHGLASVIGLDLVEHPGLAPVLLDLLHQVVPVRPLCRPLLQSLHSATLGFFRRRQAWRWRRWRRCWRCWWWWWRSWDCFWLLLLLILLELIV